MIAIIILQQRNCSCLSHVAYFYFQLPLFKRLSVFSTNLCVHYFATVQCKCSVFIHELPLNK